MCVHVAENKHVANVTICMRATGKICAVYIKLHKTLFPVLRRLSAGGFHSGQALAAEFELSRSSIFYVLKQASEIGVKVHAVRGRGYCIPEKIEWLDRADINRYLNDSADIYDVQIQDSVDSTNTALMAAANKGARTGTVFCAEHQYAGRGRRGRTWHAALGGSLTFSMLWRVDGGLQSLAGLSLAVGLAIARAVNRHSRYDARLKWPNDVLVDYRKLAGVLVEVQGDMDGPAFAVIGVGLNVKLNDAQRDAVDQALIDMAELGVTAGRNQLLADCLAELNLVLNVFRQHGFAALRDEWSAQDAYAGRPVALLLPQATSISGWDAGVDSTGAFLLRDARGHVSAFNGGEISLRLDQR